MAILKSTTVAGNLTVEGVAVAESFRTAEGSFQVFIDPTYTVRANSIPKFKDNVSYDMVASLLSETGGVVTISGGLTVSGLTASHVLYAGTGGAISGEATLSISRGGTGAASVNARYALLGSTTAGAPSWRALTTADISDIATASTGITQLGTISSGVWQGTTIATAYGGTGLSSFTSGGAVYATNTSTLTTGTLPASSGGTGLSSFAVGDILYASSTSALSRLAAGTSGYFLRSNGAAAPSWAVPVDTNYYPTAFAWTAGAASGPTGSLTGNGMSAVSFAAIPSASATASGIITTGTQTIAGNKTFSGSTYITGNLYNSASAANGVQYGSNTSGYGLTLQANSANTTTGSITISTTLESTSSTTGALKVSGGVGIAKNLYVGGILDTGTNLRIPTTQPASLADGDIWIS